MAQMKAETRKNEQLHEESRVEGLRLEAENTPELHVLKDIGQRRREAALHREVAAVKEGHFYSAENGTDESRNTNTSSCMKREQSRGLAA